MILPEDLIAGAISNSGLSIYDDLASNPELVYELHALEARLTAGLRGLELNYPIKTRAKVAKQAVARVLGYPIPKSFKKTQPRFPGQNLDVFVQLSNNLQIWNEEVDPGRRYALIRVDAHHVVSGVRVLTGEAIALLDNTGTLTSKFQAKRKLGRTGSALVSALDTGPLLAALGPRDTIATGRLAAMSPSSPPEPGAVHPIAVVYDRLRELEGVEFEDPGLVQERNRGVEFQKLVCAALGMSTYADAGQFPDILSQALEAKMQLSPTIDLGLVSPDSTAPAQEVGQHLRHCDVRYVVAYGTRVKSSRIRIDEVVVTTGASFFEEFQRFEGRVTNAKLQIPLPNALFETERSPDL